MKNFICCLLAIALIACNDKEGDDYVVQPGTYAFKQSEQIVYVTPTTESFRLEAYYVSEPDDASRGQFMIGINEEKSSPNYASHFPVVPQGYMMMTEDENGTFYSDVSIYPESITEDVVLTLRMRCGYEEGAVGFDGNAPINETTIILRPDEEVSYTEYSLSGTSCEWNFTKEDSDIIVVNSREELEKYIVCDGECTAPSVYFEKHSLVIAHGGCTNGIHQIGVSKFVKFADEKYGLYIDIVMGWTDAPELWTYAIITDKICGQNSVELFVDIESL